MERLRPLVRAIRRWERRVQGRIQALEARLAEGSRAEELDLLGKTLLAHQAGIRRGADRIELPDYRGDGTGRIECRLDPALSVRENAERLIREAVRLRRGAPRIRIEIARALEEAALASGWVGRLDRAIAEAADPDAEATPEGRRAVRRANRAIEADIARIEPFLQARGFLPRPPGEAKTPRAERPAAIAEFPLAGGWTLLVGRNGAQNAFLTGKIAGPKDLWFHAQGHAGAHVVLRPPRPGLPAPPELVELAAGCAAWLSRGRNQDRAEVVFAERRFVRKPRKAPPGLVMLEQSRSIRVAPRPLPEALPPPPRHEPPPDRSAARPGAPDRPIAPRINFSAPPRPTPGDDTRGGRRG